MNQGRARATGGLGLRDPGLAHVHWIRTQWFRDSLTVVANFATPKQRSRTPLEMRLEGRRAEHTW